MLPGCYQGISKTKYEYYSVYYGSYFGPACCDAEKTNLYFALIMIAVFLFLIVLLAVTVAWKRRRDKKRMADLLVSQSASDSDFETPGSF